VGVNGSSARLWCKPPGLPSITEEQKRLVSIAYADFFQNAQCRFRDRNYFHQEIQ
jgi:hypothetical protein